VQQARFDGKVVVVTGASSGMGLAAAELLAAEGAKIVAVGRRKDALEKAAAQLKAAGARPLPRPRPNLQFTQKKSQHTTESRRTDIKACQTWPVLCICNLRMILELTVCDVS
jgi:NAD(P)-dependent dehydrogenase (short-subunit alcohol dehydrogenase family)